MVTLKDVAKDAGVSVATVSCCLSGSKPVKESTRMKILESIEKLKYIPNASARNLKAPRSHLVGVVLADIDDLYHAEIFKGISSLLQNEGYTVSVAFSNNRPEKECAIINDFIGQNAAGLLIITCQPRNRDFFRNRILAFHIPVVFLERVPEDIHACLAGFQNEATAFYLTDTLLEKGYRRIALVCGPAVFTSEKDCILGYERAFVQRGIPLGSSLICTTNMTKEDAFKTVISTIGRQPLEAVISTSDSIHRGTLEALKNRGFQIPGDILPITFSEESWNKANRTEGVVYTSRTAFHLGSCAAGMLLKQIRKPGCKVENVILTDPILKEKLPIPPIEALSHTRPFSMSSAAKTLALSTGPRLKILLADLATAHNVELLADYFMRKTGVSLSFDYLPQEELLACLCGHTDPERACDIFMYDIPWLAYLVQNSLLADITDFITGSSFHPEYIFPENLENCRLGERYYGIPLVGGTQLLFYRKDLFEDSRWQKLYYDRQGTHLRPPRTWPEFNRTAAYFTRAENPDSPTAFGTSMAGFTDEELAPEIWIRLWAENGSLWDGYNRACLDRPENQAAFESILATLRHTENSPFATSIPRTVEDFSRGKTAMLITYSEYATQISRSMHENIIGRVGYEMIPGRRPASVGWNLGLNPYSANAGLAFLFFDWLCQPDTNFYITILDGQSPVMAPYHSQEILRLYPWMAITEKSFAYTQKRKGPYRNKTLVVPQNKIEAVLCQTLRQIVTGGSAISQALADNQERLAGLLLSYGYPRPFAR